MSVKLDQMTTQKRTREQWEIKSTMDCFVGLNNNVATSGSGHCMERLSPTFFQFL